MKDAGKINATVVVEMMSKEELAKFIAQDVAHDIKRSLVFEAINNLMACAYIIILFAIIYIAWRCLN